jgi:hypothetical protein
MWPYSADENEWLSPLRPQPDLPQPDLPPPDRPATRTATETKPADEQRAEALAAFKSSLLDGCRRPRIKH